MRPLKLKMAAFGPYAAAETIDFREAIDAGLFGIYGPTGSGKSSIFSAITFALFGRSAKEEQPIASLRSAHAAADTLTEVALLFQLGPKRYLVRREPDQMRPKSRGEGETSHAHAAWLFDVSAVPFDDIDLDGCGVPLAEKKVSLANEQIRELLGYGDEQFRQIILLPQGRFERFLAANSAERLKILRELFDVSLYRRLTEKLKEQASTARRTVSDGYRLHGQRLLAEGFETSDALDAGIASAEDETARLAEDAAACDANRNRAEALLAAGVALDARFVEARAAAATLAEIDGRCETIAALRLRRGRAELAQRAIDVHDAIALATQRHAAAAAVDVDAAAAVERATETLREADIALAGELDRSSEIEAGRRETDRLERLGETLRSAADLNQRFIIAAEAEKDAVTVAAETRIRLEQVQEEKKKSENDLNAARRDAVIRAELLGKQETAGRRLAEAENHSRARTALESARSALSSATHDVERLEALRDAAERQAVEAETLFIGAQASLLAIRLTDGEACPVCGAHDHPAPASGDGDVHALEAEWQAARRQLATSTADVQQAISVRSAAASRLEERETHLASLEVPSDDPTKIKASLADLDESLAALGEGPDPDATEVRIKELGQAADTAQELSDAAQVALQRARTEAAVARRSYEDHIAGIPPEFRDQAALAKARTASAANLAARIRALEDARDGRQLAADGHTAAIANRSAAAATQTIALEDLERARTALDARLSDIGLSAEQYHDSLPDVDQIDELGAAITAHDEALQKAKGALAQASAAIADAESPDLAMLRAALTEAQAAASQSRALAERGAAGLAQLIKLKIELAEALSGIKRIESESGPLLALAAAFQGDNDMNTPLESFAIGAMFDLVLETANLRFEPMTAGRYQFERDVESSGGKAKRGLDVRVHDIQTGRPRELSTLSGGETFIAALALALGLSDVVEASHGAIRLDTIFIDEGFGSLDTENDGGTLEDVLQVLQHIVGQSRAVGLISHVPLVQQAVPNGFNVIKDFAGSRIEVRRGYS